MLTCLTYCSKDPLAAVRKRDCRKQEEKQEDHVIQMREERVLDSGAGNGIEVRQTCWGYILEVQTSGTDAGNEGKRTNLCCDLLLAWLSHL